MNAEPEALFRVQLNEMDESEIEWAIAHGGLPECMEDMADDDINSRIRQRTTRSSPVVFGPRHVRFRSPTRLNQPRMVRNPSDCRDLHPVVDPWYIYRIYEEHEFNPMEGGHYGRPRRLG